MSYNDNNGNNPNSYWSQNNYGSYNDPSYGQGNYTQGNYDPYAQYQQNGGYNTQYNDPYNQYNQQYYASTNAGGYRSANNVYSADEISAQKYNLVIGAVLIYGFFLNAFMTYFLGDVITDFVATSAFVFYVLYFAMAIAGVLMIRKSDNPIVSFIGYNFIAIPIGMVIAATISLFQIAGYTDIVATAFLLTGIITVAMMFLSSIFPNFFLSLGRTLGITLLITIVIELIAFFLGAPLGIIDYVVVVIFCGYIGYDWAQANAIPKTVDNAVDSAAELYLDIANLFLRLMSILARSSRN